MSTDPAFAELLAEVRELRAKVAELESKQRPGPEQADAPHTRRDLLKKAGVVAAGAGVATVLASSEPAAAANGGNVILGATNKATASTSVAWDGAAADPPFGGVLFCANSTQYTPNFGTLAPAALGGWAAPGFANVPNGIYGYTEVPGGNAVVAIANNQDAKGIEARCLSGTSGESAAGRFSAEGTGPGVVARVTNSSNAQPALHAFTTGQGPGVLGEVQQSTSGANGVLGLTNGTGSGVRGEISNASSPAAAVFGVTAGTGAGVSGRVVVPTSSGNGMFGATAGTGNAIRGRVTNTANTAPCGRFDHDGNGSGLQARSTGGVGGTFQGGAAAARFMPKAGTGAPSSGAHQVGEMVVDSNGDVYFCTAAGSPGTWKKVTLS